MARKNRTPIRAPDASQTMVWPGGRAKLGTGRFMKGSGPETILVSRFSKLVLAGGSSPRYT